MPEKREQARSATRTSRKTRAARSGLNCSKPNPDRVMDHPLTTGWTPQADSVRPSRAGPSDFGSGKSARWDTGRDIPGVGMSGRPKPRSDVGHRRNARSPTGREPQGDGAPIVIRVRPEDGYSIHKVDREVSYEEVAIPPHEPCDVQVSLPGRAKE